MWQVLRRCRGRALLFLLLPILPGCLVPFGFPKLDQTPLASLGTDTEEIHAFRVDVTRTYVDIGGTDQCILSEVTFTPGGWVLPQTKVSVTYGMYVVGIVLNYPTYVSHAVGLKLYRPGYDLVELDSWEFPKQVAWKQAVNLEAQEQALDRLFLMVTEDLETKRHMFGFGMFKSVLAPGSVSAEHQRALLFGAKEYDRLASTANPHDSTSRKVQQRLESKAEQLRKQNGVATREGRDLRSVDAAAAATAADRTEFNH
jgi:hypothetical protein